MGKWVFIPWVGCQNTMDSGVDIYVPSVRRQNPMGGGSIYHGYEGQYTMVRGSQYHGSGESKYHGYVGQYAMGRGDQNPMGKWVFIPWIGG